ncbi:hypothetical protein GCM10009712_37430 [Pseudarthrobacter sulfonivorans]
MLREDKRGPGNPSGPGECKLAEGRGQLTLGTELPGLTVEHHRKQVLVKGENSPPVSRRTRKGARLPYRVSITEVLLEGLKDSF